MKIKFDIPLNPKQIEMYNLLNEYKYTEFLFYGSSRAGKTFLILYWFIVQCAFNRANCLVVRKTFTSLQDGMLQQTLPAVLTAIAKHNGLSNYHKLTLNGKPLCEYRARSNSLVFFNDSYIKFASIQSGRDGDSSAYDKILSTEWGHIFVDEVSEIDYDAISTLFTRRSAPIMDKKVPNCILYALNPTTKVHWAYKRFFKHESVEGEKLPDSVIKEMYFMHFSVDDNSQFQSTNYKSSLQGLSRIQRMRFLEGEFQDVGSGTVFRNLKFLPRPNVDDIVEALIYTDPSAKDGKKNDFKASVLLVRTKDSRTWMWDCRAIQGSTDKMLENIRELYLSSPVVPRLIMERKQLPLDFDITYKRFQQKYCFDAPIKWDTINHGDKFTCIEATLEPLVNSGRFVFCNELKVCGCYEELINQFVLFSKSAVVSHTSHDDIPDAAAKGTSFFNYNIVRSTNANDDILFYRRGTGLTTGQFIN